MMIVLIFYIFIFILSLAFLIKSSDYFIGAAEKIGLFFGVPSFIIGVSIVAFGTSLPELISSIYAVIKHSSEIVVGNVIGSNITNIFLILGITAITCKDIALPYDIAFVDLPLLVGSAFLLGLMTWDGNFSTFEALLCIMGIVVYSVYAASNSSPKDKVKKTDGSKARITSRKKIVKTWMTLIISGIVIFFSAKYTVESIIRIAEIINIGKELIAASAVALGTSLPELIVSVVAAKKKNVEIAIGNILGSNIFNTLAVMGISALFGKIIIPDNMVYFGMPTMLIATLLFFLITQQKRITQWEGWLLIIFYIFFIGKLFKFV